MEGDGGEGEGHFEGGEHLALFLAVDERVVVLHRDERREVVLDGVVCKGAKVNVMGMLREPVRAYSA